MNFLQANPLYHKKPDIHLMGGSRGMLAANQPLVVPMLLRLSNFKLNSYVVLVVSKQKGITLVFKTDPLQNVDINSTFDSFTVIQKFIQKEIEGQLRQMFREDLPGIIHRLSQQWVKKSTTVEAPYLRQPAIPQQGMHPTDTKSNPDFARSRLPLHPEASRVGGQSELRPPFLPHRQMSTAKSVSTRPSLNSLRSTASARDLGPKQVYDPETGTFVTVESEEPAFSHLGRIHRESKGLADLAEESSQMGGSDGEGSFDVVDWEDNMTDVLPPRSELSVEYESMPAVGGGVISRPRVYHASSLLSPRSTSFATSGTWMPPSLTSPALQRLSRSFADVRRPSPLNPHSNRSSTHVFSGDEFDRMSAFNGSMAPSLMHSAPQNSRLQYSMDNELEEYPFGHARDVPPPLTRQESGTARSSSASTPSTSAIQLDTQSKTNFERLPAHRRSSISSCHGPPFSNFSSPYSDSGDPDDEHKIVLRPGLNNAISQLSLLNRSNQTLSPFNRPLNHFTIRSVPPKPFMARRNSPDNQADRQPVKAKRKRTYRLGGSKAKETSPLSQPSTSPVSHPSHPRTPSTCASDFDAAEINHYFHPQEYSPHVHNSPLLEPHSYPRVTSQNSVRRRMPSAQQRT